MPAFTSPLEAVQPTTSPCGDLSLAPPLPFDVVCDIIVASAARDLRRFALVCRLWHEAAYGRLYNTLELRAGPGNVVCSQSNFEEHAAFLAGAPNVAQKVKHLKVLAWTSFIRLDILTDVLSALPNLQTLHVGATIKAPLRQEPRQPARAPFELSKLTVSERLWGSGAATTCHDFTCLLRLFGRIDEVEISGFGRATSFATPQNELSCDVASGHENHGPKLVVRGITVHSNVADDSVLRVLRSVVDTKALRTVSDGSQRHQFMRLNPCCARSYASVRLDGIEELSTDAFHRRDRLQTRDARVMPLRLSHCMNLRVLHAGVCVMLLAQHGDSERAFNAFVSSNWNALICTLAEAPESLAEIHITLALDRPFEATTYSGTLTFDSVLAQLGSIDWLALRRVLYTRRYLELLRVNITMKDVFLAHILADKTFVPQLSDAIASSSRAPMPMAKGLLEIVVSPPSSV